MANLRNSTNVLVREVACKSILNQTSLGGYSLNCYTGCAHACVYCYARFMQRFHPHEEPWGQFVDVKINAVEVLKRQLRRREPAEVFLCSACDGWQSIEAEYGLTRRCCQLLVERGFPLRILTKSALVTRDLDLLVGHDVQIGVTITTLQKRLQELWEPHAAPVNERLGVLTQARQAGLSTAIMFGPLLPLLSDSQDSLNRLFELAAELEVDHIWVDAMNPRPRVWPAVAELLRREFPELSERYRHILFDRQQREQYLAALRSRLALAAGRQSLTERVVACF